MSDKLHIYAILMDKFRWTPDQIGELTDYQINKLAFHKRKKTGEIDIPPKSQRVEKPFKLGRSKPVIPEKSRYNEYFESYQALFNAFQAKLITQQDFDTSVKKLQTKFADVFQKKAEAAPPEQVELKTATYEENVAVLKTHLNNGIITKNQFDEAVARLKNG